MSKKISAALLITDGKKVLTELAFGRPKGFNYNLDLPKGELDDNEDPIDAAIRETFEETGLDVSYLKNDIKEIGLLPYTQNKDIYLCALKLDTLPDLSKLHCESYFTSFQGIVCPEISNYYYIDKDELVSSLYRGWSNTLTDDIMHQIFGEN